MASFDRMATVTASTKRSGGITDGLETAYAESIASLKCLPLDSAAADRRGGWGMLIQGIEGLAWTEALQTACEGGLDIVEGDLLVVAGTEYPIRAVAEWTWRGSEYKILLLQETK